VFKFDFVTSYFRTGRFVVAYIPDLDANAKLAADNIREMLASFPSMVMDLGVARVFEFTVPYIATTPAKRVPRSAVAYGKTNQGFTYQRECCNGILAMYMETESTVPANMPATLDVWIWVKGGPDFQFLVPASQEQPIYEMDAQSPVSAITHVDPQELHFRTIESYVGSRGHVPLVQGLSATYKSNGSVKHHGRHATIHHTGKQAPHTHKYDVDTDHEKIAYNGTQRKKEVIASGVRQNRYLVTRRKRAVDTQAELIESGHCEMELHGESNSSLQALCKRKNLLYVARTEAKQVLITMGVSPLGDIYADGSSWGSRAAPTLLEEVDCSGFTNGKFPEPAPLMVGIGPIQTTTGILSRMFAFWRGSMRYTIVRSSNVLKQGYTQVEYDPTAHGQAQIALMTNTTTQQAPVIMRGMNPMALQNTSGSRVLEVEVPFHSPYERLFCNGDASAYDSCISGALNIGLSDHTDATNEFIHVYHSGGNDFVFEYPYMAPAAPRNLRGWKQFINTESCYSFPNTRFVAQGDEGIFVAAALSMTAVGAGLYSLYVAAQNVRRAAVGYTDEEVETMTSVVENHFEDDEWLRVLQWLPRRPDWLLLILLPGR
jgi:hypothetical protein